jgi:hypothetical protein
MCLEMEDTESTEEDNYGYGRKKGRNHYAMKGIVNLRPHGGTGLWLNDTILSILKQRFSWGEGIARRTRRKRRKRKVKVGAAVPGGAERKPGSDSSYLW